MKRATMLLFGLAALATMSAPAAARDGCGRGWFFNGRACVQQDAVPRFYNDGPVYAPERGYHRQGYRGDAVRPTMGRNGTMSCGNPNYTWQDGACRPYHGR